MKDKELTVRQALAHNIELAWVEHQTRKQRAGVMNDSEKYGFEAGYLLGYRQALSDMMWGIPTTGKDDD